MHLANHIVSIVRYEKPYESVRQAVNLCRGLDHLPSGAKVFIKPNIVFWTKSVPFPKWGVITTSRVVTDMVVLLKEHGIDDIIIGEGMVTYDPKDTETPAHGFESLGYTTLQKRYGVKTINVMERPFKKLDLGGGVELAFNRDVLESDFVVDLPVMKAHAQTMVSLGIKNLKGLIDIPSRKKCHNVDQGKDLHFYVSRLADQMPPMLTLLDGIYTNERGPGFDGRMHRSNLLVASTDVLSADLVGAKILGFAPDEVPHLALAAANRQRSTDLSDIETAGETIADVARTHKWDYPYKQAGDGSWLPIPLAKMGIEGVSYRKYDLSLCTYCSSLNGIILAGLAQAWKEQAGKGQAGKGQAWDGVEVLTGKSMVPTPGMKKTILLGKCINQANKNHPDINEAIAIKGCPPKPEKVAAAFQAAGIPLDPALFANMDRLPGFFMARYRDRPEFDEKFFRVPAN